MTGIGHIYKIICTVEPTFCYIGSTFDVLWKRMGGHRKGYNAWIGDRSKGKCSWYPYFEKYGIENFKIVLIKSYEVCREYCKDRRHLEAYETLWINRHRGKCCNKVLPIGYLKKERAQKYYYQNKEHIDEYQKEYSRLNKATLDEYRKEYSEKNRVHISEYQKEYKQNNKAKIAERQNEKVECECGCTVSRSNITRHRKSKKHIKLMASKWF